MVTLFSRHSIFFVGGKFSFALNSFHSPQTHWGGWELHWVFIRTPNPIVLKPWTEGTLCSPDYSCESVYGFSLLTSPCEDDPNMGHHQVMIIIMRSSSGAWFSITSALCPVDIHIYHPSVNDHHTSPRLVKSKGFSLECCRSSQIVHQGSDILNPGGPSTCLIFLFPQNWSLVQVHHSEASSNSPELPQQRQNLHAVYLNSLLFIWTSVSSCLPKRDLIILRR